MKFNLIDVDNWDRKEYFEHYMNVVPCTYSITVDLDITKLLDRVKQRKLKLYPVLIFMLTKLVNKPDEIMFRMSYDKQKRLGYWDLINPSYTIFNQDTQKFSSIWTESAEEFDVFNKCYLEDIAEYGQCSLMFPKKNEPSNTFSISCVPWVTFTGFNLNIAGDNSYLAPIFTIGKYVHCKNSGDDKIMLPVSIQAHHSVCDGFHVSRFVNELQDMINEFEYIINSGDVTQ